MPLLRTPTASRAIPVARLRGAGGWVGLVVTALLAAACALPLPDPPDVNLPTQPAVLDITPAPTLDSDATATILANQLRPSPTPAGLYIIQSGDTLTGLAERFDTTVEELLVANDLSNPDDLQAGQEIIIPSLLPTAPVRVPTVTVTISPTTELTRTTEVTVTQAP